MRNWKAIVLGLVVFAGSALGVRAAVDAQRPHGSDVQQLQEMLRDGERAAEQGNAGAIHRFISPHYQDDIGLKDTQIKYQINRYLRDHRGMELTIPSASVQVQVAPDGKTASMDFSVSMSSGNGSTGGAPIHLDLVKEPVFYYLVFPGEEWKVVKAGGYPAMEVGL